MAFRERRDYSVHSLLRVTIADRVILRLSRIFLRAPATSPWIIPTPRPVTMPRCARNSIAKTNRQSCHLRKDEIQDAQSRHRIARRFPAFETLAQKRRTGPGFYLQSRHQHYRWGSSRRRVARHEGNARQMIPLAWLLVGLLASSPADTVPCWVVKRAVTQYGQAAAEAWARAKGFSTRDIKRAKRCLKS